MSAGKKAVKKSQANASRGSKARAVARNERTRHDKKIAKGRKTRG